MSSNSLFAHKFTIFEKVNDDHDFINKVINIIKRNHMKFIHFDVIRGRNIIYSIKLFKWLNSRKESNKSNKFVGKKEKKM